MCCMLKEANPAIHINERIADYSVKVCQVMSDGGGMNLLAVAGEATVDETMEKVKAVGLTPRSLMEQKRRSASSGSAAAA